MVVVPGPLGLSAYDDEDGRDEREREKKRKKNGDGLMECKSQPKIFAESPGKMIERSE
ncbi:hypothetical protein RUM43_013643, partial [Polyplax serrata]